MKNKLSTLILLFIQPWLFCGLGNECMAQSIDSVHVTFNSLETGLLRVHLMSDRHTLSFFKEEYPPLRHFENLLIYQTHSYDTIDYLFSRIDIILDNPPIYDTSEIINSTYHCCPGMSIKVFCNGNAREEIYTHYSGAYFPFAYAELYSFIRQILAKYWKKK